MTDLISRIQQQITKIENSGSVAPINTWISSYIVTKKSGKFYKYYRLMTNKRTENGNLKRTMVRYLGNEESIAYKDMVKAIKRRNRIQELQRKLRRSLSQNQPQQKRGNRNRNSVNCPLTTPERTLLLQLQQQVGELKGRLLYLERELKLSKKEATS